MIQALTPNGTDQAFDVRILPRRLRSGENFLHTQPLGCLTKLSSIAAVAVAQQVSRSAIPRERIEQLMCYPFRRRICGHGEVDDASPVMGEDHEYKQQTERSSWNHEEVGGGQILHVILEECPPGLGRWPSIPDHVFGDSRR